MAAISPKRLFLVDAMGFVFRAFYAPMERLRGPGGLPTKVPYVFANMLRKLDKDWAPDYLAVVFDVPGPTFRDDLYKEYKAQRPPMPEDLVIQLPMVRRLCEALRLPLVERQGFEADDVIGTLSRQAAERGLDVFIVTADKDMLQLVRDQMPGGGRIRVFNPGKGDLLADEKKVEELLGVPPARVVDVMALMGDSIDNIPGAKGIGEKGARELIQKYGSAESALEHAAEVPNKRYREALQNSRDMVVLSKKLAAIETLAPLDLDLPSLAPQPPDRAALRTIYAEFGFGSLLREIEPPPPPPAAEKPVQSLSSAAALREFLAKAGPSQEVAVWVEALPAEGADEDEEPGFGSRPGSIALSLGPETAATIDPNADGKVRAALEAWLADATKPKTVHDPKLTELLLNPKGGLAGVRHAVRLYSYLLRPATSKHGLDELATRFLNAAPSLSPGEKATWLARLGPQLRAEVEKQGLLETYERIDLPLAPVLARMEYAGVRIDREALAGMSKSLETEIASREKEIYEMSGVPFNINSSQQLAEILFDKLNLPAPRKSGKTKARSTAADVLEDLAAKHPLPAKILEYREASKLKSTYVDALPRVISPIDGRLHTRLSQTGAATGRLSSSSPNLQNIPVRTEAGRQIRAAFVAEPGTVLLSADYSQIELRLLAHFSGDPVLVEAFQRGQDIHARTAEEVFGVGPLAQTAEHRRSAKAVNFGIIYGLSAFGLAGQLGIERSEAAKFIAAYFARYRGVKEYLEAHLAEVRQTGFTRTLFGRVRPIPEIQSPQGAMRALGERIALNTPLQGTAADLIKLAMIEIDHKLADGKLGARMILQVHDELLFEAPQAGLVELRALVKEAMERVHPLRVPLVADLKSGPNWRDMN
ncbi:MAG TPA: DNA polymerase I [Candidatus Acidoferrales bacterium]|nr:DNA polymerase I [Candidatus Acidoferrales bacterium]